MTKHPQPQWRPGFYYHTYQSGQAVGLDTDCRHRPLLLPPTITSGPSLVPSSASPSSKQPSSKAPISEHTMSHPSSLHTWVHPPNLDFAHLLPLPLPSSHTNLRLTGTSLSLTSWAGTSSALTGLCIVRFFHLLTATLASSPCAGSAVLYPPEEKKPEPEEEAIPEKISKNDNSTTRPPADATALLVAVDDNIYALGCYYLSVVLLSSTMVLVSPLLVNTV